jgi:hypothetical protein
MTNGFSNFKNKATDQIVTLPSHYAELFPDTLELTDEDVECVDCNVPERDEADPPEETAVAPTSLSITEPAKRTRRTDKNS